MALQQLTDIPTSRVQQVEETFRLSGCTDIQRIEQGKGLWTVRADCPAPDDSLQPGGGGPVPTQGPSSPAGGATTPEAGNAGGGSPNFRSLVAGGFYSSTPNDMSLKRSIRTNNPGALNVSAWQRTFPGYVGVTQADSAGNITTIYVTPEHGVAAWFNLITNRYGFGATGTVVLRELARRYAGVQATSSPAVSAYVTGWGRWSGSALEADSEVALGDDARVLLLARAMFGHEAGQETPLGNDQIGEGVNRMRAGTLPAN